MQLVSKKK